jgi:hypothetical protein
VVGLAIMAFSGGRTRALTAPGSRAG